MIGVVVAECSPGHFSYDGHEPCRPCPRGYYQVKSGQRDCTACPGHQTAQEGSSSPDHCTGTGEFCGSGNHMTALEGSTYLMNAQELVSFVSPGNPMHCQIPSVYTLFCLLHVHT